MSTYLLFSYGRIMSRFSILLFNIYIYNYKYFNFIARPVIIAPLFRYKIRAINSKRILNCTFCSFYFRTLEKLNYKMYNSKIILKRM